MISLIAIFGIYCCVIVGKESDKNWEDELITKKENKEE